MASFLEGQLRNAIAKGFRGKLLVGTLTRTLASGVDEYGDIVPGIVQNFRIEGFTEDFSVYYRQAAGIPATTVKVVLIAGNSETAPIKEDLISFRGAVFKILKVSSDPSLSIFECEGTSIL